jgi:hypothetical protein
MSGWLAVAVVVGALWIAGLALAVALARSAARGDRLEVVDEEEAAAGERPADRDRLGPARSRPAGRR